MSKVASGLVPEERTRLEAISGIVFDIQRYSLHDGPGLRTNVFLKGCPLHCDWCANPESQHMQPELALTESHCITCGQFETPCPACWASETDHLAERVTVCPTGAIHWIGEQRTAGEIMAEVRRDVPFYGQGGGLTLTGGEATMQPDLAEALLRLAKAEGISTAIETCGHTRWAVWERLLPHLDHILYDLKHTDSERHRTFTGLGNELILTNLQQLATAEAPLTLRVPLIPGFNADPASLTAIVDFVTRLAGPITGLDLLPYHTLGRAKYAALGRDYPWQAHQRLTETEVTTLTEVITARGLKVRVGG